MKISQKQASLLAKEVHNQLLAKKIYVVPVDVKSKVKAFIDKRNKLIDEKDAIQKLINDHDYTFNKVVGKNIRASYYDKYDQIIKKIEEANIPPVSEIEDEIILKSMFQSEDDMEKFVEKIVAKYSKKAQSKITAQ